MANDKIERPVIIPFTTSVDDRGIFQRLSDGLAPDVGKPSWPFPPVKRVYCVRNFSRGTVRGFHLHKREWKFFSVIRGAAKFVAVVPVMSDDQPPRVHTISEEWVCTLTEGGGALLAIPPGWANAWMSLTDDCVLVAMSTSTFEESVEDDFRFPPDRFDHYWKVRGR